MNPHSAILLMLLHLVELFEIVVSRAQIDPESKVFHRNGKKQSVTLYIMETFPQLSATNSVVGQDPGLSGAPRLIYIRHVDLLLQTERCAPFPDWMYP
jgi:hypothetical protein